MSLLVIFFSETRMGSLVDVSVVSNRFFGLEHRCQTQGPRARCGPPRHFMWPASA